MKENLCLIEQVRYRMAVVIGRRRRTAAFLLEEPAHPGELQDFYNVVNSWIIYYIIYYYVTEILLQQAH